MGLFWLFDNFGELVSLLIMEITKREVIRAVRLLLQGMKDETLSPSEYILVGELLEWHQWFKGNRQIKNIKWIIVDN